ncbi:MAG: carboxypeptidase regulatory-like domain-containing protein [Candidatus Cloacimonetes bacterium]|nr:carboxypeptidase regulatory-like domain-containing protein [Candidatus Cloacimonadota bacterium]
MKNRLLFLVIFSFRLLFSATITGSIVNETGNQVINANVVIIEMSEDNGSFFPTWQQEPIISETFLENTYLIENIPAGNYIIYAFAPLFDTVYYNNSLNWQNADIFTLTEDSYIENIDFTLSNPLTYELSGVVSDYNTDSLPEVRFDIISLKQNFYSFETTITNEAGFYQTNIPSGDYIFAVSHLTENLFYEVLFYNNSNAFLDADIVHIEQYSENYDFNYEELDSWGNYLSGIIFDDGEIPEYPVFISVSSEEDDWEKATLMKSDGSFIISGLNNGTYHCYAVSDFSPPVFPQNIFDWESAFTINIEGNVEDINFEIKQNNIFGVLSLDGFVTDLHGNQIQNVSVILLNDLGEISGYCQTNHFGFFEIQHIVPDNYQIMITKLNYTTQIQEISISDDETMNFAIENLSLLDPTTIPDKMEFYLSNYPNPFNPSTTILFKIPSRVLDQNPTRDFKNTRIEIYNIKGQKIKELEISPESIREKLGINEVVWNGTDNNNKFVSSGIYLYKLKNDKYSDLKKMILLK